MTIKAVTKQWPALIVMIIFFFVFLFFFFFCFILVDYQTELSEKYLVTRDWSQSSVATQKRCSGNKLLS